MSPSSINQAPANWISELVAYFEEADNYSQHLVSTSNFVTMQQHKKPYNHSLCGCKFTLCMVGNCCVLAAMLMR